MMRLFGPIIQVGNSLGKVTAQRCINYKGFAKLDFQPKQSGSLKLSTKAGFLVSEATQ